MHHYSFDFRDPIFTWAGWQLSFQVITLENVYGLDPAATSVVADAGGWRLSCTRLSMAGQQRFASGGLWAEVDREGEHGLRIRVRAEADHKIRAVKILARGLAEVRALDAFDEVLPEPADRVLCYPNPLRLPLMVVQRREGERLGFRCEDHALRAKRFAVYQERMGPLSGTYTVECIHEEDARHFDTQIEVPPWIFDDGVSSAAFRERQLAFNEQQVGLKRWEDRLDVPAWAREIRLCLTLHGMHWTGYIFNTYDRMLDAIRYVTERLDGPHVLAYLPGWEGRYYWQYGDYRPDPLLGGAEGFARLCDEARNLGVHVMPMFGGNCANAWSPNFHTFGPSSYMKSATRNVFHGNQPDWDTSRAHDTGWQAWLNPGAPAWQNELSRQILGLVERYHFDAVFLDTVEVWVNDPDFNIREGYAALVARLREGRPDLLVAGEDWWDGLLDIFPIFQRTGPWRQEPEWVGRYARLIGHICEGDPSRGSTGVFESGYAPYVPTPDSRTMIPTLALVDGTLEQAPEAIQAVIEQARRYSPVLKL